MVQKLEMKLIKWRQFNYQRWVYAEVISLKLALARTDLEGLFVCCLMAHQHYLGY